MWSNAAVLIKECLLRLCMLWEHRYYLIGCERVHKTAMLLPGQSPVLAHQNLDSSQLRYLPVFQVPPLEYSWTNQRRKWAGLYAPHTCNAAITNSGEECQWQAAITDRRCARYAERIFYYLYRIKVPINNNLKRLGSSCHCKYCFRKCHFKIYKHLWDMLGEEADVMLAKSFSLLFLSCYLN